MKPINSNFTANSDLSVFSKKYQNTRPTAAEGFGRSMFVVKGDNYCSYIDDVDAINEQFSGLSLNELSNCFRLVVSPLSPQKHLSCVICENAHRKYCITLEQDKKSTDEAAQHMKQCHQIEVNVAEHTESQERPVDLQIKEKEEKLEALGNKIAYKESEYRSLSDKYELLKEEYERISTQIKQNETLLAQQKTKPWQNGTSLAQQEAKLRQNEMLLAQQEAKLQQNKMSLAQQEAKLRQNEALLAKRYPPTLFSSLNQSTNVGRMTRQSDLNLEAENYTSHNNYPKTSNSGGLLDVSCCAGRQCSSEYGELSEPEITYIPCTHNYLCEACSLAMNLEYCTYKLPTGQICNQKIEHKTKIKNFFS